MTQASRVELHIEELVLHGVPLQDRDAFAAAFTFELTRLLTEQGAPTAWGAGGGSSRQLNSLDAGILNASPGLSPGHLATRVAQAIYTGMGGTKP